MWKSQCSKMRNHGVCQCMILMPWPATNRTTDIERIYDNSHRSQWQIVPFLFNPDFPFWRPHSHMQVTTLAIVTNVLSLYRYDCNTITMTTPAQCHWFITITSIRDHYNVQHSGNLAMSSQQWHGNKTMSSVVATCLWASLRRWLREVSASDFLIACCWYH